MKSFLKLLSLTLVLFALAGCAGETPTETTEAPFCGLVLEAPAKAKVILYRDFTGEEVVRPSEKIEKGETTRYYYDSLTGNYRYLLMQQGCYSVKQSIHISEADAAEGVRITLTPQQKAGTGYEPDEIYLHTEQLLSNFPCDPALWPDYPEAFQTPAMAEGRAAHQATTQEELESFIASLDEENDNLYVFSMGSTPLGKNLPLLIYTKTDLSDAADLTAAAARLQENGKLTVHYQAQMHGNETGGGEGALAMVKRMDSDLGDALLENLNLYIIPRVNPDAAATRERISSVMNADINGDALVSAFTESQLIHKVYNLFTPEILLDSHEYSVGLNYTTHHFADLQISPGFNARSGDAFVEKSIALTGLAFDALEENGITYRYFDNPVDSRTPTSSRAYFSTKGSLTFLMESRGTYNGNYNLGRRSVSHLIAAWTILSYAAENAEEIRNLVEAEQAAITEAGMTYEEEDILYLQLGTSPHPEWNVTGCQWDIATGEKTTTTFDTDAYDVALRSRPTPTAYVIPAGESWAQTVLEKLDLHGISYAFLPEGSKVFLQQYTGSVEEATLTPEQEVAFPKGAYVISMAQASGNVISMLFEPDVTELLETGSSKAFRGNTLAQYGTIPCEDGVFPLYRYIRDLNPDGTITFR